MASERKPPAAGKGRPKGAKNKIPKQIKEMVAQALVDAGGVEYLVKCASNPRTASAFLSLVGKTLPLQMTGPDDGPVQTITRVEIVALKE